jgi:hypothetical protein
LTADARPLSDVLRSADDVIAALRARQDALSLSNDTVEALAGFCGGTVNKYLGPAREKSPTLQTLALLLGALGVGVVLVEDTKAAELVRSRWTRREERHVQPNGRVAKTAIARARPIVMSEAARKAATARWAKASLQDRKAQAELMVLGRQIKQHTRMSETR